MDRREHIKALLDADPTQYGLILLGDPNDYRTSEQRVNAIELARLRVVREHPDASLRDQLTAITVASGMPPAEVYFYLAGLFYDEYGVYYRPKIANHQ